MSETVPFHVQFKMSEEARALVNPLMALILDHHKDQEPREELLRNSLEALAIIAACLIVGGGPKAMDFFNDTVSTNVEFVLAQMEQQAKAARGKMQ
jgi:hypothetical protein